MRANKVLKNGLWGLAYQVVGILLSFVGRTVFIKFLSAEYLGIAGLFTNVLSILSLSELGFSSAVSFHLYKLLATEDHEKTAALMNFYKKVYRIVALVVLAAGLAVLPFLKFIIKDAEELSFPLWYVGVVYLIYLAKTVTSYLYSYNFTLAVADQKAGLLTSIDIIVRLAMSVANILTLVIFHNYSYINYVIYLLVEIAIGLAGNIIKTIRVRKRYPYIRSKAKIDPQDRKRVMKDVSNIFAGKVATVVVNATDNILISAMISVATVGHYSNYSMIITQVQMVLTQFTSATQASLGNMLAFESKEYSYSILKKLTVIVYFAASFCAVCLFNLLNPFVKIWLGEEYLLDIITVALCVLNFFVTTVKAPLWFSLGGAGYFAKDRNIAIWGAVSNLGVSILCTYFWGLPGVFFGTVFSQLTQWVLKTRLFVKVHLGKRVWEYLGISAGLLALTVAMCAGVYFAFYWIPFTNDWVAFFCRFGACLVVPNLVNFLIFRKSEAFKYIISFIKRLFKRKKGSSEETNNTSATDQKENEASDDLTVEDRHAAVCEGEDEQVSI